MNHRSLGFAALALGFGLLLSSVSSCKEADTSPPRDVPDAAARRVLFKNLAERVIAPTYADFTKAAGTLEKASATYASSEASDDLATARAAFVEAMLIWQRAEVFQVGPSASVTNSAPGSQGLRQEIYAWNAVNRCGISRALVDKVYADDKAFADLYPNARGLGALEILLFDDSADSGCAKTNSIITSGAWDKLSAAELAQRRALYAKAASADVVRRARELEESWRGFAVELAKAGDGSELFQGTNDALNALTDALFYLDTETKDMKLVQPLGLDDSCTGKACFAFIEHPFAKISSDSIKANLEAWGDVFRGLPPANRGDAMWGLRDLLQSISADPLAEKIDEQIEAALTAIGKVESLEERAGAPDEAAKNAYKEIRALTDLLKTELIAVLSLQAPMSAAGDND